MTLGIRRNAPLFIVLISLLHVGRMVTAQEATWGGSIDSSGSVNIADYLDDPETEISATSALWAQTFIPVGADSEFEATGQVSYTWSDDRAYLFDVDFLRLAGQYPGLFGANSVLRATAGRFSMSDATALILSDTVDGVEAELVFPGVRTRLSAAYTGLLLNPVSGIIMTDADLTDSGDDDEFFGARRLVGMAEISFPEIVARQTVTVSTVGQWDLRDAETDEETFNSGYFGLALDGPILPGLFYEAASSASPWTTEVDDETEDGFGLLISARLRYFRNDWRSSQLGLRGVMASGAGDALDPFVAISRDDVGIILDVPLRNIVFGEVSYSVVPFQTARTRVLRDLQVGVSSRTFFRVSTDEVLDTTGVDALSDGRLVGNEAALNVGWRVLSDLGLSLTGGVFVPATGSSGVFSDERTTEFSAQFQLSASF
ncbi:MAG: hypothetical protein MI724_18235 [Spirochaetales bacterium]|nr:hypothetical protein [Spirochaetales bacterium]